MNSNPQKSNAVQSDLPMVFLRFLRRRSSYIAIPAVTCLALGPIAPSVMAVDWDPAVSGGTALGGAGTWDTTTANWWDGAADVVWPNTATSVATFGGAAGGAVTINTGTGVTANSLVFDTTGYVLSGAVPADVLNLAGATPGIAVTNATDTATINAIIAGTAGFTKTGLGTLVLGGVNTNSGVVNVNAGTLSIGAATGLGDGSATNTIGFGGGTLRTTATMDLGVNRTIAVGAGGGTLSAQTGTILTVSGALSGTGTLSAAGGGTVVLSNNNSGFSGNVIVDSIVGNTTNTTLRLSNANALTSGTVTVKPGVAVGGGNGNQVELAGVSIGSGVNLVLDTVTATNARSSLFGGSGTSSWAGGIQLNGDGLAGLNAGTGATLNVSGNITGPSFTGIAFVRGAGTGNITGTINLPTGNLVKTDGGTWNINSTGNTWGNTGISVGTLRVGIANALPSATAVTLGQNDTNNATLDLNGFSQTIGSLATNPITGLTGTKTVTSATAATLTINGTANTTYAGVITGASLALVKQGAGIQTLTATNTFGGGTTIDAGGALQLGDKTAGNLVLAAGTAITNNGTLIFAPGTATGPTYNNTITGNGNITLDAATASNPSGVTISGANTGFTGSYTLNQGRMVFATQAAIGATTVPITVNGNATNGGQFWLSGAVSVANPLTLNGYGPLETAGNLGAVRMAGGTLAGAISLGSNASINPENSNVTISGNISGLAGAQLLYGVPGTARNGNVTVTSPGGNTYAGGTLVRLGTGTLNANVANSVGTGTLRVESGTASFNVANAFGTAPIQLSGGAVRVVAANPTVGSAGVDGLNGTYFNFANNPGVASTQFATDQLYLEPRSFSRIDAQTNIPQPGANGTAPIVPVPGFSITAGAGISDGFVWKGLLNITNAGTYQFKGTNDDNLTLYIDGVQVGSIGVVAGLTNIGSGVSLTPGAHSIVIKQTQGGGGGYATVRYNGGVGSDAPTDELLGTDAGSITTGYLAPVVLGSVEVTANSTLDIQNNTEVTTLNLGNATLTVASQTLDNLSVAGATISAATPTITSTANNVLFNGAIGESSAGLGLNLAGGRITFNAANSYTGTTTVTGGQLRLNKSGAGNAIAGNLTINSANANGEVANVVLLGNDQIADTATVTMTAGVLQLGANNDTIGSLAMNGGRIIGNGTLTVNNLGTSTLTAGSIETGLAGAGGLTKTGTGLLAFAGAGNSYTGATTISNGILSLRKNAALGAGGAGNETTVSGTGQLLLVSSSSAAENVSVENNNGLRSVGGNSTLGGLAYTAAATAPVLRVDGGELGLNSAPTSTASITKTGNGTLTFNYNVGATLPTNVIHSAGALGFSGTQSFGAVSVPSGRAFKFNSDPGAGVDITAPTGTTVIDGGNIPSQLLTRINGASTGSLALSANSSANLDFTADASLSLGAVGERTYSGTITPGASGYRLGGGGGTLHVTSTLSGANNLTINQAGTVSFGGPQNFTGSISIDGAGRLRTLNNTELGNASNAVTLTNGGTLETIGTNHNSGTVGALFGQSGNVLNGARSITVGTGGGTINTGSFNNLGNFTVVSGANALTGSGNLTKTGHGELIITDASNFSGNLTMAINSGRIQLRSGGTMANVASLTIGQGAEFLLHNNGPLGQRQFAENPGAVNNSRLNNSAPITLAGGSFFLIGNDAVAANELEAVGAMTLNVGRNQLNIQKGGGGGTAGVQLDIANLIRPLGGGVLHVTGTLGTLGTAGGDHARINPLLLNGSAIPTSTASGTLLPWATQNGASGLIAVGVTGFTGLTNAPVTAQAPVVGLTSVATTRYSFAPTGATQNITLAAGNREMAAFQFVTNNTAPSLLFGGATDTLFLVEGALLADNNNQTRTVGSSATRGRITSGGLAATAGAKELFFHANQGTLAIESVIVDNNGAVTVHKGVGGGVLELRAANTYTGGTIVHAGRVNANVAGSLGTGSVTIKGSQLELRQPGTISGGLGSFFTASDQSELYLQNAAGVYNTPTDRFLIVGEGTTLTGGNLNANQGLASLTRVDNATFTGSPAGGQVVIPANTVIRTINAPNGVVDINMPANLGTNADLYLNISGAGGAAQNVTVGAGTPWKGLSSGLSSTGWNQGTINANGDFYIQGLNRLGANNIFNLGVVNTGNGYTINNLAGKAIRAYIEGRVDMNEDSPISLPSDLTIVATPNSYLVPNYSQSFGAETLGMSRASLLAQGGSTVDLGGFVPVGAAGNQPQGIPYPIPSPLNAFATFESGSRLLLNDASGAGSTTGGATWTMKGGSVLHLGNAQAFLGSSSGLINSGQIVYEPGAVVRIDADNIFKLAQFTTGSATGNNVVLELYNGNRSLTDYNNPTIVIAPGTSTIVQSDFTLNSGNMLTNDSADRQINERRGKLILNDGAVLAATSQTYLNVQENIYVPSGSTVTIGSNNYIDGNPKLGAVQLTGPASNVIDGNIVLLPGTQLAFGSVHVWPDAKGLDLPNAVTSFPATGALALQPGNGTSLLLNTVNYTEYMGALTGSGAVIANAGGTSLGVGYGVTAPFTFGGVFKNTNGQSPSLVKVGAGAMNLTGTSDTTGTLFAAQGEVILSGPNGRWSSGGLGAFKGGVITLDNSADAVANRFGGTFMANGGGEVRLLGHATSVADVTINTIANSTGGIPGFSGNNGGAGMLTIVPSGDLTALRTSMTIGTTERFDNAGARNSTWLIRGTGLAGLPGSHDTLGVYTPNAANPKDGLVFITDPNFVQFQGTYDSSGGAAVVRGGPGTAVVPTLGHILGATSATATEGGFITIDTPAGASRTGVRLIQDSEYVSALTQRVDANSGLNVRTIGALNVTGGDTRFQVLRMDNGSSLNVSGTYGYLTQPSQVVINAGGILVPTGATATLNASNNGAGADSIIRTNGGVAAYLHAYGTLNVNGEFYSDVGIVKSGGGTVNFAAGSLNNQRGFLVVNDGTVNLNESLSNTRNTASSQVGFSFPYVALNGGTLNLNGNSQSVGRFESSNPNVEGGTVTSVAPATLTVNDGGGFNGHINGAISLDKVGNNTLTLHNTQGYTGTTTVRQGTLLLRSDATLASNTINLNYARIDVDDGQLAYVSRFSPTATFNFRGGDFVNRGRAGVLTQQTLGTTNLIQGHNLFQTLAGGGGATETIFTNFNRSAGTTATFNQNYGFIGAGGNDTTAIRYLINNISVNGGAATTPAALMAANNGILGGWAIANNDHFAVYDPVKGISYMSNTQDGFATYNSGDLSTATATQNVNDGTARTIAASKTVNSWRMAGNVVTTLNTGVVLTLNTGGLLARGGGGSVTGGQITSNSGELNVFVNDNFTIASQITGDIAMVKSGNATLTLTGNNNYTGLTYFIGNGQTSAPGGGVTLNTTGANGTTTVAVPGDLQIHSTTVSESLPNQIKSTANVSLYGSAILNLRDAASTTETLNSVSFFNAGGDANNRAIISRANAQATSALTLTGATAITSSNDNPISTPTMSTNIGSVNYTNAGGATLMLNSPSTTNGLAAVALLHNANVGTVPTNIAEGGLIKSGNGLLVLGGAGTGQFGNPATAGTEVFNIQSGIVRVDQANALGPVNALTTVQSGATLLLNNAAGVTGSVRLKNGSSIGVTITGSFLGATAGSTGTLDIPTGATVSAILQDYFIPATNVGNLQVTHQVTGSGTINLQGIEYATGYNAGGLFQFRNETNTYSGTVNVNTNTVFESSALDGTGNAFGTAAINLNGGTLRVRDQGDNTTSTQSLSFSANNLTLSAPSYVNLDRQGAAAANKTLAFGSLNVAAGDQSLFVNNGNNFTLQVSALNGLGNFQKAGLGRMSIGSIGTFAGNLRIAGPYGLNQQSAFNSTTAANLILPTSATVPSFTVAGSYITEATKTLNVTGAFTIDTNPGTAGAAPNVAGMVAVTNTTTFTAGSVVNNGILGATGGTATITAAGGFSGSGNYVTNGQQLNLFGGPLNGIKVAGNNTVNSNANVHNLAGVQVQTGTLKLTPTAAATSTGAVEVLGHATPTTGVLTTPVSGAGTLNFDASAAGTITHTGNISNSGTIRASGGSVTVNGTISGTATTFKAGLLEGFTTVPGGVLTVDGTRPANSGNFGIQLEPRMFQTNAVTQQALTGHTDNDTWIYTGYIKDDDGVFSFAQNVDDRAAVWIDGVLVLNAANGGTSRVVSTAFKEGQSGGGVTVGANLGTPSQNFGPGLTLPGYGSGWHTIELRFNNGTGGSGPIAGDGFGNNYGLGYKNGIGALNGADYIKPIDNGTGNLFVTPVGGKGTIRVDASTTLTAGGTTLTAAINLVGGDTSGTAANLKLSGAAFNSDADALNVSGGATPQGKVNADAGHVLSVPAISVASGGNLTINPTGGTGEVKLISGGAGANGNGTGTFTVSGGMFNITTGATLTNTQSVTAEGGEFKVNGTATAADVLVAAGGTLSGSGVVNANITQTGGIISPGNSPGLLTANGNIISSGGSFVFDIAGTTPVTGYDQFNVAGTIDLGLTTVLTLNITSTPAFGDKYFLITNDDVDSINGIFAGITDGLQFTSGGYEFVAHYNADSSSGNLSGGNDFALIAVPEPGAAFLLLSTGFLCFFRRRRRE